MDTILDLENITKIFDGMKVIDNISIRIKKGEFLTILGPSGCGKTTTLRIIAGFENPSSGNVILENEHVENKPPHERNVNTVFQNYALFPHMTVSDNISYSLRIKKMKKMEIAKRVKDMLSLIKLDGFEKRRPDQLSGGQKQRVAIARALINKPKILLLDEPLGALDLKLRKEMQIELRKLQKSLGITFVYVTHDQEEALNMSDRIVVMNNGAIEQIGTPQQVYEKPITKFVAGFIGESNLIKANIEKIQENETLLKINDDIVKVKNNTIKNENFLILVRPENVKYSTTRREFSIRAVVKEYSYSGALIKIIALLSDGQEILIYDYDKKKLLPEIGNDIWIFWEEDNVSVI